MVRGIKSLVEQIRKRSGLGGYVITEFTDVEWEANGILDFFREKKAGIDEFINVNSAVAIIINLNKRNYGSGDMIEFDLYLMDNDHTVTDLNVQWEVINSEGEVYDRLKGSFPIKLSHTDRMTLTEKIVIPAPEVAASEAAFVKVSLMKDKSRLMTNKEEITITNTLNLKKSHLPVVTHHLSTPFIESISELIPNTKNNFDSNAILLTGQLDEKVIDFLQDGGRVLFLAEEGDRIPEKAMYPFRPVIEGESWERASSLNYINKSYFKGIPLKVEMGWEFEGLYPDYLIPFSDYKKEGVKRTVNLFGNSRLAQEAKVISGYFQGWLGQNGGTTIEHAVGQGKIIITTLKLKEMMGVNPIAAQLLIQLIKNLGLNNNEN